MSPERRFVALVIVSAVFTTAILLSDGDGLPRQLFLGLATVAFLWLFARWSRVEPRQIICAVIVASIGEVVLSLGWGLYTYQHALIPLYVPPGHGLFYALAVGTSQQAWVRQRAAVITRAVLVSGSVLAVLSLAVLRDQWGFLLWIGALALIARSRNPLLLSACFVYTMVLEWVGTAVGNWRWSAEVPFVGLYTANPPAGVGIIYILLDLIVVAVTSAVPTRSAKRLCPAIRTAGWSEAPES
jgi:hypothetical protein